MTKTMAMGSRRRKRRTQTFIVEIGADSGLLLLRLPPPCFALSASRAVVAPAAVTHFACRRPVDFLHHRSACSHGTSMVGERG
jgi:hypothetical protein